VSLTPAMLPTAIFQCFHRLASSQNGRLIRKHWKYVRFPAILELARNLCSMSK
jgi:hypothetical protein